MKLCPMASLISPTAVFKELNSLIFWI